MVLSGLARDLCSGLPIGTALKVKHQTVRRLLPEVTMILSYIIFAVLSLMGLSCVVAPLLPRIR